jgi:hypothetical protein
VALDASVVWHGDHLVVVDGVGFELGVDPTPASAPDRLRILKPRWMVEEYLRLIERDRPARIVELGIYDGGSTALLALAARPRRLVACDLAPSAPALDAWVARAPAAAPSIRSTASINRTARGSPPSSMPSSERNRSTWRSTTRHICSSASVASFEVVFPRLRPGGVFVLEDWAWVHDVERVLMEHPERLILNSATISEPPTPLTAWCSRSFWQWPTRRSSPTCASRATGPRSGGARRRSTPRRSR